MKNFEPTMVYREELQIVSIEEWELANRLRRSRKKDGKSRSKWTRHPFAKILRCPKCGGIMYGISKRDDRGEKVAMRNVYRCHNREKNNGGRCNFRGSISENVVAKAVIPFTAQVLEAQLGLDEALQNAADRYGKTSIEKGLEAEIRAELKLTQEAKNRVVKAIAKGIFSAEEADYEMSELRQKEYRLQRELLNVNAADKIRNEFLVAMEALKNRNIEHTLWTLLHGSKKQRNALTRLLALIYEPMGLEISREGNGSCRNSKLIAYEFTEDFFNLISRTNSTHGYADVIIPRGGSNLKAIQMVVAQIQRMLDGEAEA